ncbi:hypothetical protein [Scytonema sp. HK-05]|uniref:hypothetical protein n=1 Tax=Scytonema sp. HK-05 TaxID=1137095 RepID=UPI000936EFBC|nr:hypothetical protein [Scytonema sp. HK-05]OKH46066.1 hypothetical protein NIES2130_36765 [Scytonema sp. HK-05]
MQRRCDRNRKRSKRRAIYCPIHGCYLQSVSQKYTLFADRAGQLQQRGVSRQNALMLLAAKTAVSLEDEWLEAFWCEQCQETKWYHVQKHASKASRKEGCSYEVSVASVELWQQAIGAIDPKGNPSVGEFTRSNARMVGYQNSKYFLFGG